MKSSESDVVSHTPGEWKLDKEQMVSMRDQAQMLLDDIGTDREWVAVGLEDCDGFAEVIAMTHPQNARLIAAAPDLLEACKAVWDYEDDKPMPGTRGYEVYQKLEAAIIKATNEH